jgi:hypothetical protein
MPAVDLRLVLRESKPGTREHCRAPPLTRGWNRNCHKKYYKWRVFHFWHPPDLLNFVWVICTDKLRIFSLWVKNIDWLLVRKMEKGGYQRMFTNLYCSSFCQMLFICLFVLYCCTSTCQLYSKAKWLRKFTCPLPSKAERLRMSTCPFFYHFSTLTLCYSSKINGYLYHQRVFYP